MEVPEDWNSEAEEYDVVEWFNFDGNGKARRADATGKPKVWYSGGWYYFFDENGVMLDDWYKSDLATSSTINATNANAVETFSSYYGTKQGSGWIYTDKNDDGEYDYYYLVTYRDKDNKNEKKNVPFNSFVDDDHDAMMRAKSINGKIYLFDKDGAMKSGLQKDITPDPNDGTWGGVPYKGLASGTYYFNNGSTGVKGQMMYGKQTVEKDGETYRYYFDKKTGKAVTNAVVDGCYYGEDGDMVRADDGNATVIVTSNGKLKTSTNGYTKVDGEQYKVTKSNETKNANGISTWEWDAVLKRD